MAGTQGLTISRFTSAGEAQRQFPTLAGRGPDGDTLKGAVRLLHLPSQPTSFLHLAFNPKVLLMSLECVHDKAIAGWR